MPPLRVSAYNIIRAGVLKHAGSRACIIRRRRVARRPRSGARVAYQRVAADAAAMSWSPNAFREVKCRCSLRNHRDRWRRAPRARRKWIGSDARRRDRRVSGRPLTKAHWNTPPRVRA